MYLKACERGRTSEPDDAQVMTVCANCCHVVIALDEPLVEAANDDGVCGAARARRDEHRDALEEVRDLSSMSDLIPRRPCRALALARRGTHLGVARVASLEEGRVAAPTRAPRQNAETGMAGHSRSRASNGALLLYNFEASRKPVVWSAHGEGVGAGTFANRR